MTYHDADDDGDVDGSCGGEVHLLQVNHDDTDLFKSNLVSKKTIISLKDER